MAVVPTVTTPGRLVPLAPGRRKPNWQKLGKLWILGGAKSSHQMGPRRTGEPIGAITADNKEVLVRPSGFEPLAFCSGAIRTPSTPSVCSLDFQQLGASAFAQPTTPNPVLHSVSIRF